MDSMEAILGEGTKVNILNQLLQGARTARELSSRLKIRESAIRMHLEKMVEMGLLSSKFLREGVGRPKKKFMLTSAGHELFTKRYDLLADALITTVSEKEGEKYLRELFVRMGQKLGDAAAMDMKRPSENTDTVDRPAALVNLMNQMGERAELIRTSKGVAIVNHNCIFRSNAMKHPNLFCEAYHKTFMERLVYPYKVSCRETMARGATSCVFTLEESGKS